ncbi:hypothetical protein HPB50_002231 [Hyalomma asiaticum]|uniref:Uncharacterized protein n=1 Tax=Hyalomma asiaticum TaxID=266040 RepID=A0ACB7RIQ8_HYAAI|nr:hypothetical protein HPB50_002231 [Hyalomma asiaticum]
MQLLLASCDVWWRYFAERVNEAVRRVRVRCEALRAPLSSAALAVTMSSVPRKRKVLSFEEKFAIINAVSAGEKKKDVAARFNIPASSLSTILSAKDSIREAAESGTGSKKRLKKSTYADVDKAVFTWFLDTRARNVPISGAILQQKAKDFASILGHDDFKASNGWLQGFKSRHGVVGRVISGESASADSDASASWKILLDIPFERPTKIDIYQAIEMLAASWQEVRAETVANCFKKARVSVATEAGVDEEEPQEPSNPSDVSEAWDALRVNGGVPDDVALDDFLRSWTRWTFCAVTLAHRMTKQH